MFVDIDLEYIVDRLLTVRNRRWRKNPELRAEENVMTGYTKRYWADPEVSSDDSVVDDDPSKEEVRSKVIELSNELDILAGEGEGEESGKLVFDRIRGWCEEAGLRGVPLVREFSAFFRKYIEFRDLYKYVLRKS